MKTCRCLFSKFSDFVTFNKINEPLKFKNYLMDLEKIKEAVLKAVDSVGKSLGVELRVLVLIAFLVGYLLGRL